MSKHTPGPWSIYNGGQDEFMVCTERNGPRTIIAEVAGDSDTARANAKILAASPEMLDALKEILVSLATYSDGYNLKVSIRNFAEIAIAKAEGK